MEIVVGIVGFFVGLFVWAQIIYPVFLVLPRTFKAISAKRVKGSYLLRVLAPVLVASIILVAGSYLSTAFFIGSLPALVMILFKLGDQNNTKDMLKSYPEII